MFTNLPYATVVLEAELRRTQAAQQRAAQSARADARASRKAATDKRPVRVPFPAIVVRARYWLAA